MIYAVNYDLKAPGRDYSGLYTAIQGCGEWWHYLGSTWLINTTLDAQQIWSRLSMHVDRNDVVLVIGVSKDYQGWLPQEAWQWINDRQRAMA